MRKAARCFLTKHVDGSGRRGGSAGISRGGGAAISRGGAAGISRGSGAGADGPMAVGTMVGGDGQWWGDGHEWWEPDDGSGSGAAQEIGSQTMALAVVAA